LPYFSLYKQAVCVMLRALLAKPNYPFGLVLVAAGALLVTKLSPLATHVEISFSVQ
jgi:hypothetical protein